MTDADVIKIALKTLRSLQRLKDYTIVVDTESMKITIETLEKILIFNEMAEAFKKNERYY